MPPNPLYDLIEQRIAVWAEGRGDVRAVVVIGSRARVDHPADLWSDLDLILFVDDLALYRELGGWQIDLQTAIALPVWFAVFDHTGAGDPEWDFVFEGAIKADLVFTLNRSPRGREASLVDMVSAFPYRYVIEDGMRPLVKKTSGPPLQLGQPSLHVLPDQMQFEELIHQFLLDTVRAVKYSKRGEVWRAVQVVNNGLQAKILTLLVWHTAATSRTGGVLYYRGRFLEEWADPRMLALVKNTLAGYSGGDVYHAVTGAFGFLSAVTAEITRAGGLSYPQVAVEQVYHWIVSFDPSKSTDLRF